MVIKIRDARIALISFAAFHFKSGACWGADAVNHYRANLTTIVRDAKRWRSHPRIVLVTNMMAAQHAPPPYATQPGPALLGVAQATRDVARSEQTWLVDANAQWLRLAKTHPEFQMLGSSSRSTDGNGYNHPTAWAHREVYEKTAMPVLVKALYALHVQVNDDDY